MVPALLLFKDKDYSLFSPVTKSFANRRQNMSSFLVKDKVRSKMASKVEKMAGSFFWIMTSLRTWLH